MPLVVRCSGETAAGAAGVLLRRVRSLGAVLGLARVTAFALSCAAELEAQISTCPALLILLPGRLLGFPAALLICLRREHWRRNTSDKVRPHNVTGEDFVNGFDLVL